MSNVTCFFSVKDCSRRLHHFQKYQDLPTSAARDVEQFSINGSLFLAFANRKSNGDSYGRNTHSVIYKMNDSTGTFSHYQTMVTSGAQDIEYFTISDKYYFAVAYHYIQHSVIYQWNGRHRFDVLQNIPTNYATSFNFFEIGQELFLAVTYYYENSVIYKWKDNQFEKFEEMRTEQTGFASTTFKIKNETFIAFASYFNSQQGYAVHSAVFKWSGNSFVKLQSLQTYGAVDVKSFNINGDTFLAFVNLQNGREYNIDSFIYKWDGSKFVLFQSIPTHGAYAWHPFVMCGQTFLGVANAWDPLSQGADIKSVIYQFSGEQFIPYQEIPTQGARDMTSFEYNGHTYLAFANYKNNDNKYNINSAVYKWIQN